MKRSKIPFSVRYNRVIDRMHRVSVSALVLICTVSFVGIASQVYYLKYIKHPVLKKKEQELLSKYGETI